MASQFTGKGYNSFSGVDIKVVFDNTVLAELQAISYSVTREKAPIYTMGSADPRSFSRGKRGIAGTLIFLVFDRHALLSTFGAYATDTDKQIKFQSDKDDVKPDATNKTGSLGLADLTNAAGLNTIDSAETGLNTTASSDQEMVAPWFIDQMLPIDITLAAANEYGSLALMKIFGAEMMNEGCGVSIDDIVTEQQISYVARSILPWASAGYNDPNLAKTTSTTTEAASTPNG
jgi:hypothetical protein